MRITAAFAILLTVSVMSGETCDVGTPRDAYEAVKSGDPGGAYCGIKSLYAFGVESYPVLFEMLSDDTPYYWFCGNSATHIRNDQIKIEPDVDLSTKTADETEYAYQNVSIHQPTISQVAAYIVVSIELNDLNFAEYCMIYPGSERAAALNEIRTLVGEAEGGLLGCDLYRVMKNNNIQFIRKGASKSDELISIDMLWINCTK